MTMTVSRSNWLYMQEGLQKLREKAPQASFADGIEQAAGAAAKPSTIDEVLSKLSDKSAQLLKSMKAGSKTVDVDDWTALMTELKDMGAITKSDYDWTPKGGLIPVPVGPTGISHLAPGEANREDLLKGMDSWPGDPLEKLETMALYARKWIGVLGVSQDDEGNPGSWYSGPYASQEASCQKVLKLVKDLMAAA